MVRANETDAGRILESRIKVPIPIESDFSLASSYQHTNESHVVSISFSPSNMVVVDLSEFGEETFDQKRWINASINSHRLRRASSTAEADPTELGADDGRLMSELQDALRQEADTVGAAVERDSADALRRVPMACRDAMRLRDDAITIRSLVSSLLSSLRQVCVFSLLDR